MRKKKNNVRDKKESEVKIFKISYLKERRMADDSEVLLSTDGPRRR